MAVPKPDWLQRLGPWSGSLSSDPATPWTVANRTSRPRPSSPVLQRTGLEWFCSSHKDFFVWSFSQKPNQWPRLLSRSAGPCSGGRATPAEPSCPRGSSPCWAQPLSSPGSAAGLQEHGNELLGAACRAGVCCCSVTDTRTCISKASSRQQPPNHTPRAFHRKHHSHAEIPNPLTETASVTGTGLQTKCRCERGISFDNLYISSRWFRSSSRGGEAAGAPQADGAGSTPMLQVLQVLNTLPFQDLGWAKDTLSFIKTISEATDHFGWASWCFWEMQIYIKVIK